MGETLDVENIRRGKHLMGETLDGGNTRWGNIRWGKH